MNRGLLIALIGGLASATCFLAIRSGAPGAVVFTYLASVPLLVVGLSQGLAPTIVSASVAIISIFIGLYATAAGVYIAISALPAIIVVRQALFSRPGPNPNELEWYPIGLILSWLTSCGLLLLGFLIVYTLGEEGGLAGVSQRLLDKVFLVIAKNNPQVSKFISILAVYLPGMLLSVWLLISVVNSALSQNFLSRIGHSIRPLPTYSGFELPNWMSFALATAILLSFFPGPLGDFGRNASPLLSTPFFLLGLAVIHTLSWQLGARKVVLAGLYILLIVVGWLSAVVVILGVLEQWISLRRRYGKSNGNQENH
ncbi:MAG: hypothetical protein CMM75_11110 [Rhodospirillaceae bacterium]|nr:hypothetical protein [Rhodospirillaceae bacterium]